MRKPLQNALWLLSFFASSCWKDFRSHHRLQKPIAAVAPLDPQGRHRAACTFSGLLKKRATSIERMARIFRPPRHESGWPLASQEHNWLSPQCTDENAADEDAAVLVQERHEKGNLCLRHENWRLVERRGCQHPPSARSREPPSCIGVGTSLDPHAPIHVRSQHHWCTFQRPVMDSKKNRFSPLVESPTVRR